MPVRKPQAWPVLTTATVRATSTGALLADIVPPQPYREFVNRWTTDGFRSYVGDLQSSVDRQLEASVGEQAREAEDAFFWVTHYERGSGTWRCRVRPTGIQLSPVRPHAREPIT